jgi:dTDP-glucose pyrophosphorylase
MKALVLAAGSGSRLSECVPDGCCKAMTAVADTPLIEFSLRNALSAGVDEAIIIVSEGSLAIQRYYGSQFEGLPLRYARQSVPRGLLHAMEAGVELLDGMAVLLMLSDELLLDAAHAAMVARFRSERPDAICGVVEDAAPELIIKNYDVITGPGLRIRQLIEKPVQPEGTRIGLGNIVMSPQVIDLLPSVPVNGRRGQRDLTDLLQTAIDSGLVVEHFPLCIDYVNVNAPADLEAARDLVARRRSPASDARLREPARRRAPDSDDRSGAVAASLDGGQPSVAAMRY